MFKQVARMVWCVAACFSLACVDDAGQREEASTLRAALGSPTISNLSPTSGKVGTPVTITGTYLSGATAVCFGGKERIEPGTSSSGCAEFKVDNESQLTATVPAGAQSGPVMVFTPAGVAESIAKFTVLSSAAPIITSFSPTSGSTSRSVTIYGSNFTGTTAVSFNGQSAFFGVQGDGQIYTSVPNGATTGPITVTNTVSLVNSSTNFTILPPPTISSFTPGSGKPGTFVKIAGTGFTGATAVCIGKGQRDASMPAGEGPSSSCSNFVVNSDVEITLTVPSGVESGPIYVSAPGGSVESAQIFTLLSSAPPTISAFDPTSGGVDRSVLVTGSNFTGTSAVSFNGVPAWFDLMDDTHIYTRVPNAATSGKIKVTNTAGSTESSSNFTVIPPPTVQSFSPSSGAAGATVVIKGTGFTGVTFVGFGGGGTGQSSPVSDPSKPLSEQPAGDSGGDSGTAEFVVDSDNQISVKVPLGAQSGSLIVSGPGGSTQSAEPFTVLSSAPPAITSFSPTSGGERWNVKISGSGFTGTTQVLFNGTPASFSLSGDTEISTFVPSGATTGPISVKNTLDTATSSANFTVHLPPTVTSFTPASGKAGTSVVIKGTGFSQATSVSFASGTGDAGTGVGWSSSDPRSAQSSGGGVSATFTINSDAQITATVPTGAVTGPIRVSTQYGSASSATNFSVVSSVGPSISSFSPTSGGIRNNVNVFGSGFTGATAVKFNGVSATAFWLEGDGQLWAWVPEGATSGPITVVNTVGQSTSSQSFTVIPPPTITGFSPASGPAGTTVTVTGTGFLAAEELRFGGGSRAEFVVVNDTKLTATVPLGARGGPIEIWSKYGEAWSQASFSVTSTVAPAITSFKPASGLPGDYVVIFGTGFTGTTNVAFNGVSTFDFWMSSDTQLEARVPTGASTGPVAVTNSIGTAKSSSNFIILPLPTITSFSPTSGKVGDPVVITGSGFTNVNSVRFGEARADFSIDGDTKITARVPNGARSGPIEVAGAFSKESFTVLSSAAPEIAGFSPPSGYAGQFVRITGQNFAGTTEVSFNGVASDNAFLESSGQLVAYIPQGATTGPITVTNTLGKDTTSTNFIVNQPPSISSFSPTSGVAGDKVVIAGTHLLSVTQLSFGSIAASFKVDSDNQITATVPVGAVSARIVLDRDVESSTEFVVLSKNAPTITSFSPTSGGVDAEVTLTGSGFSGVTEVLFSAVPAAFSIRSDSTLAARVPLGATSGPIKVTNNVGSTTSASHFTIVPPPSITSVSPTSGKSGDTIVLTGTGFTGIQSVQFGPLDGIDAKFSVEGDTKISVVVPAGAMSGPIRIHGSSGSAESPMFTVVSSAAPTIQTFTPASGGPGSLVKVSGSGFTGLTGVSFGAVATSIFKANSDTELFAAVPAGAVTAPISVTNTLDKATSSQNFVVDGSTGMSITDVTPTGGSVGTLVTISGTNFDGARVMFWHDTNASVISNSSTKLTVKVPAGAVTGPIVLFKESRDFPQIAVWDNFTVYVSSCAAVPDATPCDDASLCTTGETCQSGACGTPKSVVSCSALDGCHDAGACDPSTGICSTPAKKDGTTCSDAIACTLGETCQAGVCVVASDACECDTDADCPASDQCHDAGSCDPATRTCTNPPKKDGTVCDDANACTSGESCQKGICGAPNSVVACSASDQCHDAGVCDPTTGLCTDPAKTDGAACTDGIGCTQGDECHGGVCTWQNNACECLKDDDCVAQDQCHDKGTCDLSTHRCTNPAKKDGTLCDDANACTSGETCQSGECGSPTATVTCTALDECHDAGACDRATGKCTEPAAKDGTPCTDGFDCTQGDSCQNGACVAATHDCACTTDADCKPIDQCHEAGTCDPKTRRCSNPAKQNGTPCDDANACTSGESCQEGACGAPTVTTTCPARNECEEAGSCDPSTGACSNTGKPDGTSCSDGRDCTQGDACHNGSCVPTSNNCECMSDADCTPLDQCHEGGTCDNITKRCSNPSRTDGSLCDDADDCTSGEACYAGTCSKPTSIDACTPPASAGAGGNAGGSSGNGGTGGAPVAPLENGGTSGDSGETPNDAGAPGTGGTSSISSGSGGPTSANAGENGSGANASNSKDSADSGSACTTAPGKLRRGGSLLGLALALSAIAVVRRRRAAKPTLLHY